MTAPAPPTPATPPVAPEPGRRRPRELTVIYIVIIAAVVALTAVGIARHRYARESSAANVKAVQLQEKWRAADLPVPSRDAIVRQFGTDGGLLCTIKPSGVVKAMYLYQLANGAAGPGQRPVIIRNVIVTGSRAVLEVYCPDRLPTFDRIVDDLNLSPND
jgi:hypothetical protein